MVSPVPPEPVPPEPEVPSPPLPFPDEGGVISVAGPTLCPALRSRAFALCSARRMSSRALEYVRTSDGRWLIASV